MTSSSSFGNFVHDLRKKLRTIAQLTSQITHICTKFLKPVLPLRNLDPATLPGEKWKKLPGLENLYHISNYGRTRGVKRQVYTANGRVYTYEKRILKPHIAYVQRKNGRELQAVQVEVVLNTKRTMISVARHVYFLFVKKYELSDRSVTIRHKDGNKLNCHYSNLEMQSFSDFLREGYANNRANNFKNNIRPVIQYTLAGKPVAKYDSAKSASAALGIPSRYINHAASTETRQAGGFLWKYLASSSRKHAPSVSPIKTLSPSSRKNAKRFIRDP